MLIRIQKVLSEQGILSRREAEHYLKQGWILVNGKKITQLGTKVNPERDLITFVPGRDPSKQHSTLLMFNKPKDIVTTTPRKGETAIVDILPPEYKHLSPIGRLDKTSEGLILLTDNGILAKKLLTGSHEREYSVTVDRPLTDAMLVKLEQGLVIPLYSKKQNKFDSGKGATKNYRTKPTLIVPKGKKSFNITLTEGKNRQIRRMVIAVGAKVVTLKRLRFASVYLGDLYPGNHRIVPEDQMKKL